MSHTLNYLNGDTKILTDGTTELQTRSIHISSNITLDKARKLQDIAFSNKINNFSFEINSDKYLAMLICLISLHTFDSYCVFEAYETVDYRTSEILRNLMSKENIVVLNEYDVLGNIASTRTEKMELIHFAEVNYDAGASGNEPVKYHCIMRAC